MDIIKDSEKPILIIDSGMGGVIVERKIDKLFPQENKVILMDNDYLPYGNKKAIEIQRRVTKLARKIKDVNPKVIVIACNTIDSIAADRIFLEFSKIPVVQVVYPTAHYAVQKSKTKNIAVLATKSSIESLSYHYGAALYYPNTNVIGVQCDNLAKSIEYNEDVQKVYNEETDILVGEKFDTLILGCTHYSRVKGLTSKKFKDVNIIDSTDIIVEQFIKLMEDLPNRKKHLSGKTKILMTKEEDKFYIEKLYGENIEIKNLRM